MRYCTTKEMKEKIERIQNEDDFHSLMAELSTVEPGHLILFDQVKDYAREARCPLFYFFITTPNFLAFELALKLHKQYDFSIMDIISRQQGNFKTTILEVFVSTTNIDRFNLVRETFKEQVDSNCHLLIGKLLSKGFFNLKLLKYLFSIYPDVPLYSLYEKSNDFINITKKTEDLPEGSLEIENVFNTYFRHELYTSLLYKSKAKNVELVFNYFGGDILDFPFIKLVMLSNMRHNTLFEDTLKKYGYAKLAETLNSPEFEKSYNDCIFYMETKRHFSLISFILSSTSEDSIMKKLTYLFENGHAAYFTEHDLKSLKKYMLKLNNKYEFLFEQFYKNGLQFNEDDIVFYSRQFDKIGFNNYLSIILKNQPNLIETMDSQKQLIVAENVIYNLRTDIFKILIRHKLPLYYNNNNLMDLFFKRMINCNYNKMLEINQKNFLSSCIDFSEILINNGMRYNKDIDTTGIKQILNHGQQNPLTIFIEENMLNEIKGNSTTSNSPKRRI